MNADCFALLDDASPDAPEQARSRLYTGHLATLACADVAGWAPLLERLEQALAAGQYAVALCSYELGGQLLGVAPAAGAATAATAAAGPALAQVLIFRHCRQLTADQVADWLAARTADAAPAGIAAVRANVDEDAFAQALARIHAYIEAGDTYQVNYTYRLRFDAFGAPCALYARLRARQPVPYGALIALPDGGAVLSLSPELFVRHQAGQLTARPMKGTAPASDEPAQNAARAAALAADPKNRAENLMIVDLLRNDIGRIAITGSVQVPALFEVRRFSSVLQMTSTVTAALRPDAGLAAIFQALYPCGSITGAPKRRTMEIIAELEAAPRGLYTGAIGWFDPAGPGQPVGDFCLSVPIRTLALQAPQQGRRQGELGVGAGIVFDSVAREEYAECQLKASFLTGLPNQFELFETMYASAAEGVRHRGRHLARLAASAAYFGFAFEAAAVDAALDAAYAALPADQPCRLRLGLREDGGLALQHAPLTPLQLPVRVLLAPDAVDSEQLFLRHKSSVRGRYDAAWRAAEAEGAFDMLFFNEKEELCEGGRSNVFLRIGGQWLTPPLACGLLPGVMRAALLADPQWNAREAVITRAMLAQAEEIVLCNALRGALPARLQDA